MFLKNLYAWFCFEFVWICFFSILTEIMPSVLTLYYYNLTLYCIAIAVRFLQNICYEKLLDENEIVRKKFLNCQKKSFNMDFLKYVGHYFYWEGSIDFLLNMLVVTDYCDYLFIDHQFSILRWLYFWWLWVWLKIILITFRVENANQKHIWHFPRLHWFVNRLESSLF